MGWNVADSTGIHHDRCCGFRYTSFFPAGFYDSLQHRRGTNFMRISYKQLGKRYFFLWAVDRRNSFISDARWDQVSRTSCWKMTVLSADDVFIGAMSVLLCGCARSNPSVICLSRVRSQARWKWFELNTTFVVTCTKPVVSSQFFFHYFCRLHCSSFLKACDVSDVHYIQFFLCVLGKNG